MMKAETEVETEMETEAETETETGAGAEAGAEKEYGQVLPTFNQEDGALQINNIYDNKIYDKEFKQMCVYVKNNFLDKNVQVIRFKTSHKGPIYEIDVSKIWKDKEHVRQIFNPDNYSKYGLQSIIERIKDIIGEPSKYKWDYEKPHLTDEGKLKVPMGFLTSMNKRFIKMCDYIKSNFSDKEVTEIEFQSAYRKKPYIVDLQKGQWNAELAQQMFNPDNYSRFDLTTKSIANRAQNIANSSTEYKRVQLTKEGVLIIPMTTSTLKQAYFKSMCNDIRYAFSDKKVTKIEFQSAYREKPYTINLQDGQWNAELAQQIFDPTNYYYDYTTKSIADRVQDIVNNPENCRYGYEKAYLKDGKLIIPMTNAITLEPRNFNPMCDYIKSNFSDKEVTEIEFQSAYREKPYTINLQEGQWNAELAQQMFNPDNYSSFDLTTKSIANRAQDIANNPGKYKHNYEKPHLRDNGVLVVPMTKGTLMKKDFTKMCNYIKNNFSNESFGTIIFESFLDGQEYSISMSGGRNFNSEVIGLIFNPGNYSKFDCTTKLIADQARKITENYCNFNTDQEMLSRRMSRTLVSADVEMMPFTENKDRIIENPISQGELIKKEEQIKKTMQQRRRNNVLSMHQQSNPKQNYNFSNTNSHSSINRRFIPSSIPNDKQQLIGYRSSVQEQEERIKRGMQRRMRANLMEKNIEQTTRPTINPLLHSSLQHQPMNSPISESTSQDMSSISEMDDIFEQFESQLMEQWREDERELDYSDFSEDTESICSDGGESQFSVTGISSLSPVGIGDHQEREQNVMGFGYSQNKSKKGTNTRSK